MSSRIGRCAGRAWLGLVLLGCGCVPGAEPSTAEVSAATPPEPSQLEPELEAEPGPEPAAEPKVEPGLPAPVVGAPPPSDELLLLPAGIDEGEQRWRGLVRTPDEPRFRQCEVELGAHHEPASRQLIRGRVEVEALEEWYEPYRCVVVEVAATLTREQHGIVPLTNDHLAEVDIGPSPDNQAIELGDLERGPLRVFLGLQSGGVLVASIYLRDLGPLLAVPGRPLTTSEALRAELDEGVKRGDYGRVGGAKAFAPQVENPDARRAYARTPMLSLAPLDAQRYQGRHASAVPLRGADGVRYLITAFGAMKGSWVAAKQRGQMIVRILEDDLQPFEDPAE